MVTLYCQLDVYALMHCVVSNKKASLSMSISVIFSIFIDNYGMFYDTVYYLCGHAHIQCLPGLFSPFRSLREKAACMHEAIVQSLIKSHNYAQVHTL